jgi:hypothetical protein
MVKFDNYVFMTICESSLDLFKKSHFSTYVNYCNTLNLSLKSGNLDKKEMAAIIQIGNDLVLIYGFDDETCGKYIADYFDMDIEKVINFYKVVLIIREHFALSFN